MEVVLVAVSNSEASKEALKWAAGRAASLGAELRVVTAVDLPAPTGAPMVPAVCHVDTDELVQAGLAFQQHLLGSTVDAASCPARIAHRVDVGRPFGVIRSAAHGADLVVLGAGRRRRLGSLTRRCRRALRCPVVVVSDGRPC